MRYNGIPKEMNQCENYWMHVNYTDTIPALSKLFSQFYSGRTQIVLAFYSQYFFFVLVGGFLFMLFGSFHFYWHSFFFLVNKFETRLILFFLFLFFYLVFVQSLDFISKYSILNGKSLSDLTLNGNFKVFFIEIFFRKICK